MREKKQVVSKFVGKHQVLQMGVSTPKWDMILSLVGLKATRNGKIEHLDE